MFQIFLHHDSENYYHAILLWGLQFSAPSYDTRTYNHFKIIIKQPIVLHRLCLTFHFNSNILHHFHELFDILQFYLIFYFFQINNKIVPRLFPQIILWTLIQANPDFYFIHCKKLWWHGLLTTEDKSSLTLDFDK